MRETGEWGARPRISHLVRRKHPLSRRSAPHGQRCDCGAWIAARGIGHRGHMGAPEARGVSLCGYSSLLGARVGRVGVSRRGVKGAFCGKWRGWGPTICGFPTPRPWHSRHRPRWPGRFAGRPAVDCPWSPPRPQPLAGGAVSRSPSLPSSPRWSFAAGTDNRGPERLLPLPPPSGHVDSPPVAASAGGWVLRGRAPRGPRVFACVEGQGWRWPGSALGLRSWPGPSG